MPGDDRGASGKPAFPAEKYLSPGLNPALPLLRLVIESIVDRHV
jgi:hypothetical protein